MFYKIKAAILKRYVYKFCDTFRAEYKQFTPGKYPKVNCYKEQCYITDAPEGVNLDNADRAPNGRPLISGYYENGQIYIYGLDVDSLAYLKQTARHETIHFLLDAEGLEYRDTDDLFLLLAIKYDARPNADLSDDFYNKLSSGRNS